MTIELLEASYNAKKRFAHVKIRLAHGKYDNVICLFHAKPDNEEKISITSAFVEDADISIKARKVLLSELRGNNGLLVELEKLGNEVIARQPMMIEEKALEKLGTLTLDYFVALSASSVRSKETIRIGSKLSQITESESERHEVFAMVKFKELTDEYELRITYNTKNGYDIISTKANREKPRITAYLDEKTRTHIISAAKHQLEFLP